MTPILLPLTDLAIQDCRRHAMNYPETDPAILAYLTRHVNGLMCAEMEVVITQLIRDRVEAGCRDDATLSFVKSMKRSAVRNATYREIRRTVKLLGNRYENRFCELVGHSVGEEGIEKLGIAVDKRNEDAHKSPPDITFGELEEAFGVATLVVIAVSRALIDQA